MIRCIVAFLISSAASSSMASAHKAPSTTRSKQKPQCCRSCAVSLSSWAASARSSCTPAPYIGKWFSCSNASSINTPSAADRTTAGSSAAAPSIRVTATPSSFHIASRRNFSLAKHFKAQMALERMSAVCGRGTFASSSSSSESANIRSASFSPSGSFCRGTKVRAAHSSRTFLHSSLAHIASRFTSHTASAQRRPTALSRTSMNSLGAAASITATRNAL
mmetsp:Transcript_44444/g.122963  ORF Transcript_44444/g.122963 Transcript_44444/m.122963 type:complete len:220 (+) Transcript_44444:286-945(+)